MKIAIVDDEPWIVKGIAASCDWASFNAEVVIQLSDPETAIIRIAEEKPDLVFVDINMGAVSGLEVMRRVKDGGGTCFFVVISGYDDFNYAQEAMALGAAYYLLKPLKKEELKHVMEKISLKFQQKRFKEKREEEVDRWLHSVNLSQYNSSREFVENKASGSPQKQKTSVVQPSGQDRFDEIYHEMERRFTDNMTLNDLAEKFHYHSTYISDLFRKHTGHTFLEHLHLLRMHRAGYLLIETTLPVTEVGFQSGYTDPSHFSRVFRRHFGMSPTAYRAANEGKKHVAHNIVDRKRRENT